MTVGQPFFAVLDTDPSGLDSMPEGVDAKDASFA